jgi:hypothetical protein
MVRQLLIGDLGEMGFKKRVAYSYPVERKPFNEMSKSKLEKIAVIVAAGIVAEESLCSDVGNRALKEFAISDDKKQLDGIQRIGGFSTEEMQAFHDEARMLVQIFPGRTCKRPSSCCPGEDGGGLLLRKARPELALAKQDRQRQLAAYEKASPDVLASNGA